MLRLGPLELPDLSSRRQELVSATRYSSTGNRVGYKGGGFALSIDCLWVRLGGCAMAVDATSNRGPQLLSNGWGFRWLPGCEGIYSRPCRRRLFQYDERLLGGDHGG